MKSVPVLIIDDGIPKKENLSEIVMNAGFKVDSVSTQSEKLEKLNLDGYGMLIINKRLSNFNLLREIKQITPKLPVVIFSSKGTIQDAVEAMQSGASDYIMKPCPPESISKIIEKYIINGNSNKK